jgi:hypothetical protein
MDKHKVRQQIRHAMYLRTILLLFLPCTAISLSMLLQKCRHDLAELIKV